MDPHTAFCHNPDCAARGQAGLGNIRIHSRKEHRYRCTFCERTFAASRDTPLYRLKKPDELVTLVVTLLCHGCPIQAIVAAFGLDERTVAAWRDRAGEHGRRLHEHLVLRGQVDLGHVQADELYVKTVAGRVWMAMAMAVPSRLWLGGVVSPHRDGELISAVVGMVRAAARSLAILVCVDGLASYVTAFRRVFSVPAPSARTGRRRWVPAPGLLLGQVVKQRAGGLLIGVSHRVVYGTAAAIAAVLQATGTGTVINTAYIERLNATFRAALSPLTRRGRALARQAATLSAGMNLVGFAYNFCWDHDSLRVAADAGADRKWQGRTPAMAASLTDHRWTMEEFLKFAVPLPLWLPPLGRRKARPRPSLV